MLFRVCMSGAWSRHVHRLGSLLLAGALAACGGGGGGGGDDASAKAKGSGFSVTLDRTSIDFTYQEGLMTAAPVLVNATAQGSIPEPLYVGAVVEGQGISPYIPATFTPSGAQFRVSPQSLAAGTYKGRVLFYACLDSQCLQPVGGTPLPVDYTVQVLQGFKAPERVDMKEVSGWPASSSFTVQLPSGATSFTARVVAGADWLTAGVPSGTMVPLSARSLRSGTYQGSIELNADGQVRTVTVVYQVSEPAGGEKDLGAQPGGLTFGALENMQAEPQAISVTVPTWSRNRDGLQYGIAYKDGSDWLTISPTAAGLSVKASAQRLARGYYMASVRITHPETQTVADVPVSLTVGANLVKPADRALTLLSKTTLAELQGSVPVNLVEGTPYNWTATSSSPWLKLTRAAGQTGSSLTYVIDAAQLASMENYGDVKATVTITPNLAHVSPVSFDVGLRKQLAEAHFAGPYLILSDTPQMIRLRGRGFDSLTSPAAHVDAGGAVPTGVARVNDALLQLQLPALKAGSYKLKIRNEAGLPVSAVNLRVIDPMTFTYAAYPTSGFPYWVVYDGWRQSVFFLNKQTDSLVRYRFGENQWTRSATVVGGSVDNLGLGPDGDSVVTLSQSGKISLIDPDSLAATFQVTDPRGFGARGFTYARFGIPSTNDGRSWYKPPNGDGLYYLDHRSRKINVFTATAERPDYYDGPWMAASRNGERLLAVQSASVTPSPPMVYLDVTEGILKQTGTDLMYSYDMQFSDDGGRLMLDSYEVRDSAFAIVGQLPQPTDFFQGRRTAMSPDGRRVYIFAVDYNATIYGTSPVKPRVYVVDVSKRTELGDPFPILGYFTVDHHMGCERTSDETCLGGKMVISPDGRTLFMVGTQNFIVAPIPAESALTPVAGGRMQPQSLTTSGARHVAPVMKTQRWK